MNSNLQARERRDTTEYTHTVTSFRLHLKIVSGRYQRMLFSGLFGGEAVMSLTLSRTVWELILDVWSLVIRGNLRRAIKLTNNKL